MRGAASDDRKLNLHGNLAWRNGVRVGLSWLAESYAFDRSLYQDQGSLAPDGSFRPIRAPDRLPARDLFVSVNSPVWQSLQADAFVLAGRDVNFFEWSAGTLRILNVGVTARPAPSVRVRGQYNRQEVFRPDGSPVSRRQVARVRTEWQLGDITQVRVIAQFTEDDRDALRDPRGNDAPLVRRDPLTGATARFDAERSSRVDADVLLTVEPSPGTMIRAGMGRGYGSDTPVGPRNFITTGRQFFVTIGYLFRVTG